MDTNLERTRRAADRMIEAIAAFKAEVADMAALATELGEITTNLAPFEIPEGIKPQTFGELQEAENQVVKSLESMRKSIPPVGAGRGQAESDKAS